MIVEFKAKESLLEDAISIATKKFYEDFIELLVKDISSDFDLSKLGAVIIPRDFISAVMEFQNKNGDQKSSVTNNEFGRAFGKVLYNKKEDNYFIFLDPEVAIFLIDDATLDICIQSTDDERKTEFIEARNKAINLLAHELAHVEFETRCVYPSFTTEYDSQIMGLLYILFNEYYACRRSCQISPHSISSYDEKYVCNIEKTIIKEKWEYKTHAINLNQFCELFFDRTKQSLIAMISMLGSNWESTAIDLYAKSRLKIIVKGFQTKFDDLFATFISGKQIEMTQDQIDQIKMYYATFGVDISGTSQGLYFSIP